MISSNKKIIVGMSGGVDSSVAAFLLQKEKYEVSGIFIDFAGGEKSKKDFLSAQKIADKLKIPLEKIDARDIFKKNIIDEFVLEYEKGNTPNPCVICNPEMKFKILLQEADKRGFEFVATGHYALTRKLKVKSEKLKEKFIYGLFNAKDKAKDQSYFLYRLSQAQLSKIVFPLGDYLKTQVRKIAEENNFNIKSEEESQDVCFIANNDFNKFISARIKDNPGKIVSAAGKILGTHQGLHFYTIGQRKGINLGGDGPYYVAKKNLEKNELIITNNKNKIENFAGVFEIKDASWISFDITFPLETKVQMRYHGKAEYTTITKEKDGVYRVKIKNPQTVITPGQSAVFYSDEGEVLGGGIIK